MSISQAIAPHLPYLRRFARSLTGSQQRGDRYVTAALEALIGEPKLIGSEMPSKVGLYRVLIRVWDSVNPGHEPASALDNPADLSLDAIMPRPRQAFLLVSVEGFSIEETAAILEETPEGVRELLHQAGREIAGQVASRVLIIEDEPMIALDLKALVESLGHTVIRVARTRREAESAALEQRPGLILADIQLADGSSGIDAVNEILHGFDVPVVFITAYPERLLTGERPEPAFLISKPFDTDTVKAVVSQALFFDVRAGSGGGAEAGSGAVPAA